MAVIIPLPPSFWQASPPRHSRNVNNSSIPLGFNPVLGRFRANAQRCGNIRLCSHGITEIPINGFIGLALRRLTTLPPTSHPCTHPLTPYHPITSPPPPPGGFHPNVYPGASQSNENDCSWVFMLPYRTSYANALVYLVFRPRFKFCVALKTNDRVQNVSSKCFKLYIHYLTQ